MHALPITRQGDFFGLWTEPEKLPLRRWNIPPGGLRMRAKRAIMHSIN